MNECKLTDIAGIRVGHAQDFDAATGCTVIVCEQGAVAGVDVRGGSPGTIQTDTLSPCNAGRGVHAVLLSGGSAFGLDAAGGVVRCLEERGIGRDVRVTKVPVVSGAILFDLLCGDYRVRPDSTMGYRACADAFSSDTLLQGSVGAGTGAAVGKFTGMEHAMKGGIGIVCLRHGQLMVGAVVAVNCVGDVYDSGAGRIIAGVLSADRTVIGGSEELMLRDYQNGADFYSGNTVIGAVVTNARLDKAQVNKLASMAHDGIARTVRPSHDVTDGDTLFALSAGDVPANLSAVGLLATRAVEAAILRGVKNARPLGDLVTYRELFGQNR